MGLLSDKFAMVKKGLENISNVVEGNLNYYADQFGLLDVDKKEEADRRYEICKRCPFISQTAVVHDFYTTDRTDEHCSVCLCPIEKKVMSMEEECGLSYLTNLVNQNGDKILHGWKIKWNKYEK